jgi:hypothetical protein
MTSLRPTLMSLMPLMSLRPTLMSQPGRRQACGSRQHVGIGGTGWAQPRWR